MGVNATGCFRAQDASKGQLVQHLCDNPSLSCHSFLDFETYTGSLRVFLWLTTIGFWCAELSFFYCINVWLFADKHWRKPHTYEFTLLRVALNEHRTRVDLKNLPEVTFLALTANGGVQLFGRRTKSYSGSLSWLWKVWNDIVSDY